MKFYHRAKTKTCSLKGGYFDSLFIQMSRIFLFMLKKIIIIIIYNILFYFSFWSNFKVCLQKNVVSEKKEFVLIVDFVSFFVSQMKQNQICKRKMSDLVDQMNNDDIKQKNLFVCFFFSIHTCCCCVSHVCWFWQFFLFWKKKWKKTQVAIITLVKYLVVLNSSLLSFFLFHNQQSLYLNWWESLFFSQKLCEFLHFPFFYLPKKNYMVNNKKQMLIGLINDDDWVEQ